MYSEFFLILRTLPCCAGVALGNVSESKVFINSQTKAANNSVMHIGTKKIFGGILEGVWPINNRKTF